MNYKLMNLDIDFFVPHFQRLRSPWLDEHYVGTNAWYPVPHLVFDDKPEFVNHHTWGRIPCRSRTEYKAGDVILFDEFNIWEEKGEKVTDRFYVLEQGHIDDMLASPPQNTIRRNKKEITDFIINTTDLLPVGVVVHPPRFS